MNYPDLEPFFQELTDITDNIAVINTPYGSNFGPEITKMEEFFENIKKFDWNKSTADYYVLFTSYFTFHMKIVEEIIKESRESLEASRRIHIKRLVQYLKEISTWYTELKKSKKSQVDKPIAAK